ncbi:MAG TPA: lytic transglycosylase domain-containing protein, partial [Allosphingosinicella sp.]
FFKRDGSARSFAEVRNMMAAKLSVGGRTMNPTMTAQARPAPAPAAPALDIAALENGGSQAPTMALSPRYARLAYLMLADLGA